METNSTGPACALALRVFGVGNAGISLIEQMITDSFSPASCVAVNADGRALEASSAAEKIQLENQLLRGLGSGGDPERGRKAAEDHAAQLQTLCEGKRLVFILAGLGGGAGTGISPVLARIAKNAGALVLAFVTTPFECEGSRRQFLAHRGLEELKDAADGVICLPNQTIFKLIDENTGVLDTFKTTNRLLIDCVHGLVRLLTCKGLIELHLDDVCRLVQDQHTESAFAVAEGVGPARSREVLDKLFAHPMLENGEVLGESQAVLVSLTAGPDLTMAEVNRVMEEIKSKCEMAQVMMGAGIDESFCDRLAVTIIAAKKLEPDLAPRIARAEELETQLLDRSATARPNSRFVPPAPVLPLDKMQQLLANQARSRLSARRPSLRLRQSQLPLEIVSKGRFDKSEPTIHKGEDLDVPTYIRRGVALN